MLKYLFTSLLITDENNYYSASVVSKIEIPEGYETSQSYLRQIAYLLAAQFLETQPERINDSGCWEFSDDYRTIEPEKFTWIWKEEYSVLKKHLSLTTINFPPNITLEGKEFELVEVGGQPAFYQGSGVAIDAVEALMKHYNPTPPDELAST